MPDDPLANIQLPQSVEAPDNSGLRAMMADIRRQMADPKSPVYANRPELIAATEAHLKATALRAGIDEQPETPESLAERQHDAYWGGAEMNPNLAEMLDQRIDATAALGDGVVKEQIGALRSQIGAAEHDRLVADARAALNPGEDLPLAAQADVHVLRILAAHGAYCRAEEQAQPNRR